MENRRNIKRTKKGAGATVKLVGDSIDGYSFRPDFSILISPVITMVDELTNKGSRNALLGEKPCNDMVDRYSMEKQDIIMFM